MPISISSIIPFPWIAVMLSSILAFGITWWAIPRIVYTSRMINFFAKSNGRTSHTNIVPTLGGIAVFAGCVVSSIIFGGTYFINKIPYIVCGLIIVFFIGIKDDLTVSNPWKKLLGQILAALVISILADIRINNFYGLFGIHEVSYIPSIIFTVFVFIVVVNGFNLIDGIDGLASGIGILASIVFGTWSWINGEYGFTILSFSFAGSAIAFFHFNVFSKKFKLFLGDTGSLITGFVVSILTIQFLMNDAINSESSVLSSAPAIAIGILIIPLFDTLRVFTIRISQGRSPFEADRQHLHHRLLELGSTHLQATLILISVNLIFIALCYFLKGIGVFQLTIVILGLASLMSYFLSVLVRKRKTVSGESDFIFEGTWKKLIIAKNKSNITQTGIKLKSPEKTDEHEKVKKTEELTEGEEATEVEKNTKPEIITAQKEKAILSK